MRRAILALSLLLSVNLSAGVRHGAPDARPGGRWYVSVVTDKSRHVVRVFGRTRDHVKAGNACVGATLGERAQKDGLKCDVVTLEGGK